MRKYLDEIKEVRQMLSKAIQRHMIEYSGTSIYSTIFETAGNLDVLIKKIERGDYDE